jgi:hypothetical protein
MNISVILVSVAWVALTFAGCRNVDREMEKEKMGLEITFVTEKTDILFQHNPMCRVFIKNQGAANLVVPGPQTLSLRVLNVKTGEEKLYQQKRPGGVRIIARDVVLRPGQTVTNSFMLKERVAQLEPGEYEVSAIYQYGEDGRQEESAPVRITVHPTTARNLSLASGQGGASGFSYGAWVNLATESPELALSMFSFTPGGGVESVVRVDKADIHTRPILSAPPNKSFAPGQWLGWIRGDTIHSLYYDQKTGASSFRKLKLPLSEVEIVAPLHCDAQGKKGGRPLGRALLCLAQGTGEGAQLLSVLLDIKKTKLESSLVLPGSYPAWIASQVRSDGSQWAIFVQVDEEMVSLSAVPWPRPVEVAHAPAPRRLASWECRFLSAGVSMNKDDDILGACLVWAEITEPVESGDSDEQSRLEFIRWVFKADGGFAEVGRDEVPWEGPDVIEHAIVQVNEQGVPAALLKDQTGRWFGYNGQGSVAPLPGIFSETKLPLELGFLGVEPVLVGAVIGRGFQVIRLDGSPLPTPFRP